MIAYPPPYQDLTTLAEHLCLSARTIEEWVKQGRLPQPLALPGKRLWRWRDVERAMARLVDGDHVEADLERIREAARNR